MDIPRKSQTRNRRLRRILYILFSLGIIVLITLGLSRLKPAAPTVERGTVWIDTVKRGLMVRQVRGIGSLVPEEIRWIPAVTEGRVERILIKPGTAVKTDTILVELSNPDLELAALDAEMQLKAEEARYTDLRVRLSSQLLDQQATAATVQADYNQAKLQAEANVELAKQGLLSELTLKLSKTKAEELATRHEIEQKRLSISSESAQAQLVSQQARIEQLRALLEHNRSRVEALKVRAGANGVLQQLPLDVGQRVTPGTNLARVAEPTRLKAELKITATLAKDIQLGQQTVIDTHNGTIPGKVVRIDPAVQNDTVTVDVALEGPLPQGARPDLSVDGTIELERLEDVLYVGRPVQSQANSVIGLFKVIEEGSGALRIQVKLGRSSVNTVEILEGLQAGDRVVLSDTSAWDAFNQIRFK
ncbi:MAG: efflux RND transporter periplasmic adaptor subunit [Acidobacteriota bacterium]